MSAHVLLNLLNELGKEIKCELNKFNNTKARMLESIYHMTFFQTFVVIYTPLLIQYAKYEQLW